MADHVIKSILKTERSSNDLKIIERKSSTKSKSPNDFQNLDSDLKYINSSLYLFHIDNSFRRNCLSLTEDAEKIRVIFDIRDNLNSLKVGLINPDESIIEPPVIYN
jgi:hypothetical protein